MVPPATPLLTLASPIPRVIRFGVFEMDVRARELRKEGGKVRLAHQPFGVLELLLERSGDVVTREDLRRRLWSADTFVDFDLSLNSAVRKLRDALGDSAEHPTFIETLPRVGYRFIAPVEQPQISRHDAERWVQGFIAGLDAVERPPVPSGAAEGEVSSLSPPPLVRRPRRWALTLGALALIAVAVLGWRWGSVSSARNRAVSPDARELYERGVAARGALRNEDAFTYFEQAVAIQPDFAVAHGALALAWVQGLYGGTLAPEEVLKNAEAAAARALALDDTVVDAYKAVADSRHVYGDFAGAEWAIDRLQTLAPRSCLTPSARPVPECAESPLTQLARWRLSQQRFTEAVDAAERARAADARWVNAIITVARAHRAAGRHDRAIGELRKALQTNPDASNVQFQLGATYVLMGDTTAGVAELEKLVDRRGSNLRFVSYLAYAYAMDGRMRQSREILRELRRLRELQYVSYFGIAMIHDALDEKDDARVALDRAFLEHAVEFTMLDTYPRFNALVAHPRYQQLLRH